jgi:hypothetical protein
VLAKVTFAVSEKNLALRVMKAVADYYSLHRNLRLDFINGKPKKYVEHLVSVIRPATLKALSESKLEMDKSELKRDFLEFVKYLEEIAIIHEEHCHVVEHMNTGDSGMKYTGESSDDASRSFGHNSGGSSNGGASNMATDRNEQSPGMEGRRTRLALGRRRLGSRRYASTRRSVRARSTICPTVLTLERTKLLSCCQSTRKREMQTRRMRISKLWTTTERRLTTEMTRPRNSPRRISDSRSRYWQIQALTTPVYRAEVWRTQGSVASLSRSRCCRSTSC